VYLGWRLKPDGRPTVSIHDATRQALERSVSRIRRVIKAGGRCQTKDCRSPIIMRKKKRWDYDECR
jgi:hypothetical protein